MKTGTVVLQTDGHLEHKGGNTRFAKDYFQPWINRQFLCATSANDSTWMFFFNQSVSPPTSSETNNSLFCVFMYSQG